MKIKIILCVLTLIFASMWAYEKIMLQDRKTAFLKEALENIEISLYEDEILIDTIYQDGETWVLKYADYAAGEVGSAGPYISNVWETYIAKTYAESWILSKSRENFLYTGEYLDLVFRRISYRNLPNSSGDEKRLFLSEYAYAD